MNIHCLQFGIKNICFKIFKILIFSSNGATFDATKQEEIKKEHQER